MLQTNLAVSIRATSIKGDEYPNLNQSTASALFFFFFFWESKERWERCSEKLIDLCLLRAEGDTTSCSGRHRGGRLYYSTSQAPPTENCRWKHPFNLTCLFVCNLMWVESGNMSFEPTDRYFATKIKGKASSFPLELHSCHSYNSKLRTRDPDPVYATHHHVKIICPSKKIFTHILVWLKA